MTGLGNVFLGLAVVAAIVSVVSLFWGRALGHKEGESVTNIGYLATYATAIGTTVATAVLLSAFFREDFTFQYVAENHSTDVSGLSWLYKISGVWAGREGSLLFWAWLIALFAAYVAYRRMSETDELSNMSLAVLNVVQVLFLGALFIPLNNPFQVSPADWLGPNGELLVAIAMNPLLQHWAMIFHPPTLFIGYAGLAVPFAFAIGALIVGDGSKRWVTLVDRITVFAWLFLGIGIGLGAIWAYVVLGWGGYWAWDPVENASLLPWLTGVGLLHSFTVYRRRDGFKKWAVMMATVSFILVILGTFITRSGIVQSVHAFEKDPWSLGLFLSMMIGALLAGVIGLMIRSEQFKSADEFESLISKDSSYYFNNVLMLLAAVIVALLTLAPAFGGKSYGAATYDAIARPVGILYVFIMAVCPLLSWRKTDPTAFWGKVKWPIVSTVVLSVPLLAIWWTELWPNYAATHEGASPFTNLVHGWYAIIGLVVGAFAVSISVYLFVEGARRRAKGKGESFGGALFKILTGPRSQSGGYLTHLGIGIILIGLVGSAMFVRDVSQNIPAAPGSQLEVGDYTLTYNGVTQNQLPNGDVEVVAQLDVAQNGKAIGAVTPGQVSFYRQQQTKLNAAVIVQPLRDLFVVFQGATEDEVSLQVKVNPLITWVWIGFLFTVVGTTLAVWPKRRAA